VRIVLADARAPWTHDDAVGQIEDLAMHLRRRSHDVQTVVLPFSGRPEVLRAEASAWRLLDLSASNAHAIDLLIATRFPAYFARHPRKVAWLLAETRVPDALADLDARMLSECARVFTTSKDCAERLERAEILRPEPNWTVVLERLLG
jgi:hypothetical protein